MKAICRQLIQLLRRAARSEEVEPYIQRAEKGTPTASSHAGLNFCKGLLACYSNNPCEAHQVLTLQFQTQVLCIVQRSEN